jgi:hypothetical protein
MLQVFASTGDDDAIAALRGSMSFERYRPYIQSRYRKK